MMEMSATVVTDGAAIASIQTRLERLTEAVEAGLNRTRCLRRWSEFIRERDGHRCVDCHSTRNLSAHHICRKVLLPKAQYQTGNGITLCRECHREVHAGFNGRPDTSEPMDGQGGEKLRLIERLYCILDQDAVERGLLLPGFYELDEQVLAKFKLFQGFAWDTPFPGPPVRQAYLIWAQSSLAVCRALAGGKRLSDDRPADLAGEAYVVWDSETVQPSAGIICNPPWY